VQSVSLNGQWLIEAFDYGKGEAQRVFALDYVPQNPIEAWVPGEIHLDLLRAKKIEEPLWGRNALEVQWVEEKEWWYRKEFTVDVSLLNQYAELVFEGIDTDCDVYLNGEKIATHRNMFIPLIVNVTGKLKEKNVLVVRVDSGVPRIKEKPFVPYPVGSPEQDYRRVWVRKAQFTFAWDWAPRLVNVGIWRGVYVRFFELCALREVFIRGDVDFSNRKATITVSGYIENWACDFVHQPLVRLRCFVYEKEGKLVGCNEQVLRAYSGWSAFESRMVLEEPRLWWPNGMGEPHCYRIVVLLTDREGKEYDRFEKNWGLRRIDLLQEPLAGGEGESFTLCINGEKVFCKGADWVPADSIIARVDREKYRQLIDEAKEANFNMFRIWGGGIYEDPFFYEYCAEQGIMIWQDFMFACAYYPHDESFLKEVEEEVTTIVKLLRNETALVLWCGNNELEWLNERNREVSGQRDLPFTDYPIYHRMMPQILRIIDPTRPFWFSSPYGGADPNCEEEGDRHVWELSILGPTAQERVNYEQYARDRGKFVSEFGILAPPPLASLQEFLPKEECYVDSPSWQFHNNVFERGNIREMLREFVGNPELLSLEEYLYYAQLLQGEALKFALDHWRRRKFNTSGALFWMYSDCWGAIGWTILDYYLRRKASFYFVRRAFQPLDLSLKSEEGYTTIYLLNDTLKAHSVLVEYGLSSFDGTHYKREELALEMPSNSVLPIIVLREPQEERKKSFIWAKLHSMGRVLDWERRVFCRFKDLGLPATEVHYEFITTGAHQALLRIVAPRFAWGVEILTPPGVFPSDNFFDLFPQEERVIELYGTRPFDEKDIVLRWSNR